MGGALGERAGRVRGRAQLRLSPCSPSALPLPRLPAPSGCSSFLLPSGPLWRLRRGAQSRGIKRKEGGKREGKGRAEEKRGRALQRRVLSFSSGPSGLELRASAPLPLQLQPDVAADLQVVRFSPTPRRFRLPVTPPLSPASPAPLCFPFISPTTSFLWEGARSLRLSGVLRGASLLLGVASAGMAGRGSGADTHSSPGEEREARAAGPGAGGRASWRVVARLLRSSASLSLSLPSSGSLLLPSGVEVGTAATKGQDSFREAGIWTPRSFS